MKSPTTLLIILIVLFSLVVSALSAQTQEVCAEGDCSPEILSVQLDFPLNVDTTYLPDQKRTEQYKAAYLKVKQIKNDQEQSPEWKIRYETNQLNGRSCVRLNQLECYFAHEYLQNPDFARFIDAVELGGRIFKENGFESSRRAINMATRMKDKCQQEINKLDKTDGPMTEDIPKAFMALGIDLGYFDKEGNVLKQMKDLSGQDEEQVKLSKKEQIELLKEKVTNLQLGASTQENITDISVALDGSKSESELLVEVLISWKLKFEALLSKTDVLLSDLNKSKNLLVNLKKFKPKVPQPQLETQIANLYNNCEETITSTKDEEQKIKELRIEYEHLNSEIQITKVKIEERVTRIEILQKTMVELQQKKEVLAVRLEDKPRRYLEELTLLVNDLVEKSDELSVQISQETELKEKLLVKLDELTKRKEEINKQFGKLESSVEALSKDQKELEKNTNEVNAEVKEIKEQEKAMLVLAEKLEDLKAEENWTTEINVSKEDLQNFQGEITIIINVYNEFKSDLNEMSEQPPKILSEISELKIYQEQLKEGKNGFPVTEKVQGQLVQLADTTAAVSSTVEILKGDGARIQEKLEGFGQQLNQTKDLYESEAKSLNSLIEQFNNLSNEKTALINNLSNGVENVEEADAQVEEFISRYNDFNNQDKGINKEELVSKIAEIEKVKETIEAELTTLEGGFNQVATATEQIKLETEEVEKQIDKDVRKMEELKQQEEALKEEYGQAITLQPVPIETWAESVEVDRTYWQAEFHPDNEVVEGFKGRWFEVSLKDADKKVKLLFGPGEYFLTANDFRNSYGSTIGTFVTEALHSLDQPDQEKVKLFIQGSADISGHNTFSGKLEDSFFYDEIEVFPIVTNQERFSPIPLEKLIPEDDFRNDHLPDLRAAFLKEMFMRYSNKFEPIILEGAVKKFEGKEERNATIYLFFPEALLPAFEKN